MLGAEQLVAEGRRREADIQLERALETFRALGATRDIREAEALLTAIRMSTPLRRERKVVTVLFADLVGFTARAETLDPEDVDAVLRPYHERACAACSSSGAERSRSSSATPS